MVIRSLTSQAAAIKTQVERAPGMPDYTGIKDTMGQGLCGGVWKILSDSDRQQISSVSARKKDRVRRNTLIRRASGLHDESIQRVTR